MDKSSLTDVLCERIPSMSTQQLKELYKVNSRSTLKPDEIKTLNIILENQRKHLEAAQAMQKPSNTIEQSIDDFYSEV